uniref:Putative ovule protein n=1 Tax=Solanum chacoense TaxID=4108 RepID=A0A0V0H6Y1_SOLCH
MCIHFIHNLSFFILKIHINLLMAALFHVCTSSKLSLSTVLRLHKYFHAINAFLDTSSPPVHKQVLYSVLIYI